MRSRLDRYDSKKEDITSSRLLKNQHLYDDMNNKIGFEKMVDLNTQTRIELSSLNEPKRSRERYQQLKDYQGLLKKEEPYDEVNIPVEEEKVFDINAILEEARKNRNDIDELEQKRKLKNEDYNVLSDLNKKYLSKDYDATKSKNEYEGLEELINTITSKTLASDIKKEENEDLLGDLVATSIDLQVKSPDNYETQESNDILPTSENAVEKDDDTVDNSFYTRSMDLSEEDFNFDEKKEKSFAIKKGILIFIIVIILLAIIGIVAYFLLQHFNIDIQGWFRKIVETN